LDEEQHLVAGEAARLLADAYEQARVLNGQTLAPRQRALDEREGRERQQAKQIVDAAAGACVSYAI